MFDSEANNDRLVSMGATVTMTAVAKEELESVPIAIRTRINDIFERLEKWPSVSGAKRLRGDLHGSFRIRTGDYRVVFTVSADGQLVTVWKIGNRETVYD